MIIYYLEVPQFDAREPSSFSTIIRNKCILKAFDVNSQLFFITKYSPSVSYSEFFTKTLQWLYLIMDRIGEFAFTDILIGFAREEIYQNHPLLEIHSL